MFAKIHESQTLGQILVFITSDGGGDPELRFQAERSIYTPHGGSFSFRFEPGASGWERAREEFERFNKEESEKAVINFFRRA